MPDRYTSSSAYILSYICVPLRYRLSIGQWQMRDLLLFKQDVQFLFTLCVMLGRHVGALHFLTHVIDFQCKYRKPVDGPCRTFGVNRCIGLYFYIFIFVKEIAVNQFHQISTVLIGLVDTAFQCQCFHRVNLRVANNVFKVPLYCVNPVFR